MKFSLPIIAAIATAAEAHTIFQKVSVNGADQGQLKGVRATASNNVSAKSEDSPRFTDPRSR